MKDNKILENLNNARRRFISTILSNLNEDILITNVSDNVNTNEISITINFKNEFNKEHFIRGFEKLN